MTAASTSAGCMISLCSTLWTVLARVGAAQEHDDGRLHSFEPRVAPFPTSGNCRYLETKLVTTLAAAAATAAGPSAATPAAASHRKVVLVCNSRPPLPTSPADLLAQCHTGWEKGSMGVHASARQEATPSNPMNPLQSRVGQLYYSSPVQDALAAAGTPLDRTADIQMYVIARSTASEASSTLDALRKEDARRG